MKTEEQKKEKRERKRLRKKKVAAFKHKMEVTRTLCSISALCVNLFVVFLHYAK